MAEVNNNYITQKVKTLSANPSFISKMDDDSSEFPSISSEGDKFDKKQRPIELVRVS